VFSVGAHPFQTFVSYLLLFTSPSASPRRAPKRKHLIKKNKDKCFCTTDMDELSLQIT